MRSIDITIYIMYVYTLEFIVGGVRAGERGELGQELGLKLVSLALVWATRFRPLGGDLIGFDFLFEL